MKRFLTLLLVCAMFLALASPISAATAEPVQPRFAYINSTYVNLTINETTGIANCYSECTANSGVSIVSIGTLQQYTDGAWNDVKSWTGVGSRYAIIDKNWAVYSGYQYRFFVTFKIYNSSGILLESHTSSDSYYYPGT